MSEGAFCGGRQQFSALPLGCGGGPGPLPRAAGVWKAGRRGRSAWWENTKHNLTLFRSLPRAHRKPDALPDSASCEFPRSVPEVSSFRCPEMKIAENGPFAPSQTGRDECGCPAWQSFPYSLPYRAGKRGCLFFLLLKADRLCSQEQCQSQSASSLADGSSEIQGESSAVCTFLCTSYLNNTPS